MPSLRPTDLQPPMERRATSRHTRLVQYEDSEGVTRYKMMTDQFKINDDTKRIFLENLAEHGRTGTASRISGISHATIKKHIEKDPEFGQAVAEAMECYKDRLIAHHQNLVFNGTLKTTYGKDGAIVSEEQIYPIRLIELELKKHDEGYRDKKDVTVSVRGGVLIAPATVSMEDWEKKFGAPSPLGDIIEAEVVSPEHDQSYSEDDDQGED